MTSDKDQGFRVAVYPLVPLLAPEHGNAILLLEIVPGRFDDELQLKLWAADLATAEYEALSYTWGASTKGRRVIVNERFIFSVTDNLFCALRRLRLKPNQDHPITERYGSMRCASTNKTCKSAPNRSQSWARSTRGLAALTSGLVSRSLVSACPGSLSLLHSSSAVVVIGSNLQHATR